jgi:LPS sulfotransferase NodH
VPCVIITGFQRTGTTILGEWLGAAPNVSYWGEIFHPDGIDPTDRAEALRLPFQANYYRFRRDVLCEERLRAVPTEAVRFDEWQTYLAALDALAAHSTHVLNIKYSSWHNLDLAWQPQSEPPYLLRLAIERDYPIFHCLRRDALAQALSECVALATDVWHVPAHAPQADSNDAPSVEIDPAFLLRRMRAASTESALFRGWLRRARHHEFYYEDMFGEDGVLSGQTVAAIRDYIADWTCSPTAPLRKIGREARAKIANRGALADALRNSEFKDLSRDLL